MRRILLLLSVLPLLSWSCSGQRLTLGDERPEVYLPLLEGQRVAVLSNQTGVVGGGQEHVVDFLLSKGVGVTAIFSPEHGFRGKADAGELVRSSVDEQTGVPILSLYDEGSKYPSKSSMDAFDVLVVDIQDVGLRFYTYYITMQRLMGSCAQYGKKVVVLDRPNPNGFYVDGPVLDMDYASGVGSIPVPVVYGMTLGELALMMNSEGWLKDGRSCDLTVIPCLGYSHSTHYELPVSPSPNLKEMKAIYLYPSTCYFEGTSCSLGRGTDWPFLVYGHPDYTGGDFSFTPQSVSGAKNPPLLGTLCHGRDLRGLPDTTIWRGGLDLGYVIDAYTNLKAASGGDPDFDAKFFRTQFFDYLAGNSWVREAIMAGEDAAQIKARWQDDVKEFRERRKPYLLYEDLP